MRNKREVPTSFADKSPDLTKKQQMSKIGVSRNSKSFFSESPIETKSVSAIDDISILGGSQLRKKEDIP